MKRQVELIEILEIVCAEFGFTISEIISRKRKFAQARLVFMFLAKTYTAYDDFHISTYVNRSISMVKVAMFRVLTICEWNGDFADKVERLELQIKEMTA